MRATCVGAIALGLAAAASNAAGQFEVPEWAYPGKPTQAAAPTPSHQDDALLRVPGSPATFTRTQVTDLFAAPDWHPDDHAPMPDIVARGRRPVVHACGYCHLPDGSGRPENAPLAGLPAAYIEQQVADIRAGTRRSAWSGPHAPTELMRSAAEHATDGEIAAAADYFSKLRLLRRVEVVETDRVPATIATGWLYVLSEGTATERLGRRLIEVAIDHRRHELRDAATAYRAYVPPGSIARGKDLVVRGGDALAAPCAGCHGPDLRGTGVVPPLAERSPTYLLRQLLAFRTGARSTASGELMAPVVGSLEIEDMVAIAAYLASLEP